MFDLTRPIIAPLHCLNYNYTTKNPSKNLRQNQTKQATMSPSFVFEPPSDEEIEHSEREEEEEDEEEPEEAESGSDSDSEEEGLHKEARVSKKKTQSPWDFAKYTESVAEEHARKSTTSVDEKISKALRQRSTPLVAELDHSSESELDEQVIIGFSLCACVCAFVYPSGFFSDVMRKVFFFLLGGGLRRSASLFQKLVLFGMGN